MEINENKSTAFQGRRVKCLKILEDFCFRQVDGCQHVQVDTYSGVT